MQNISNNCKLKSEYFNLRIKNRKSFELTVEKMQLKA